MFKPHQPIIALTCDENAYHRLALCRGVTPILACAEKMQDNNDVVSMVHSVLKKHHLVRNGDYIVLVLGQKTIPNASNTVRIMSVEENTVKPFSPVV